MLQSVQGVMTADRLALKFEGPFGLIKSAPHPLSDDPLAQEAGLYLFAVPYNHGGYLVTYVGETSASFGRRVTKHVIQTIGGNYRICDPAFLVQGEVKLLWNGFWRKGTHGKVPEYLALLAGLAPTIQALLHTEVIWVAPLRIEKRLRRRIEAAIAIHLLAQPAPTSSVLPPDILYHPRRADESPLEVEIEPDSRLHGLPRTLEA